MKITVLGAGAMGSAVASALCHNDAITRVQVCEARPAVLRTFQASASHPKLRAIEADARDLKALEALLANSACVISCVDPDLNPRLAALAVEQGAHFVDLGGPEPILAREQGLATLAEEHQRWIVPGCGLAPGLANVLTMRGLAQFEQATEVRILVGDVPTEPTEPFNYRLAHSAEKLLEDYTTPVHILREGKNETIDPLTGVETVEVEGLGTMEAFYASDLTMLVHALEGRLQTLDVKTLRYPGHAHQMQFLMALGLADRQTLDVRTHLSYRDVLARRLRQRLGGTYADTVVVRIEITGERDGRTQTLTYDLVDRFDEATGLSAMQRCTAFTAVTIAELLAAKQIAGGGVAPPEQLVPMDRFFDALAARGITIQERWTAREAVAA
ncbi:MAG: saccharopine dehydrogenase [Rhodothermaceae bacterium]|nr:saccharopine dehydrogenase [Rhodothermaceae bacterium]